ncbi:MULTISPECIES: DUF3093 domain-containing protein [Micrococcaceae]|uniref:Membrane protein n=3 Tax=Micrococcaceae TaxID=1268 RepID=Q6SK90_PAEAU|nr:MULTISPECIES: DUF3093 domain-containing protein [Micrococcaceae]AAS20082.1 membrane protein [Paenarthrobacter aurescens]ABM10427.1 hypothetical protein AAur_pTC10181 [Paenarthrobacter aurescens TC1]SDQ03234.1 Protein of unknown function [Arthrobacter crystallopoietes]
MNKALEPVPQERKPTPRSAPVSIQYDERLWPSPGVWIIAAGLAAAVIVVLAPIDLVVGYIASVCTAVLLAALLILSTPRITVTDLTLRVGRAEIERRFIGDVEAYEAEEATAQRGRKLNGTAYMCFRGWIDPVVKIGITDEADRTPYWLVSTRRPEQLASSLRASDPSTRQEQP